jgi:cytidylate kinase
MIIAVDGPAASGKGTLARRLADHFGLHYLDTGALYRAVALALLTAGQAPEDETAAIAAAQSLGAPDRENPALRSEAVGEAASIVAAYPQVRAHVLDYQRRFAQTPPGAVLDGRDIGTVVCPEAQVKLFVTATPEVRATRRQLERARQGEAVDYEALLADIRARDARDMNRAVAPLKPAQDARLLDTSELDIEAAFKAALHLIGARH